MESIKRLLTGETDNYSMDKRFIRKDGAIIWTRLMAGCVRGPAKKVEYLVAVVQNINDRMQMEQELKAHRDHLARMVVERTEELEQEINRRREKEEQYLALIESVKEWIWEINTNNVITFVSPRIYDILGYRPEELLGKTPFDTMPPEERDRVFPSFLRGMLNKEAFTSVEVQCLHKDGRMVYMEVNGRPFFDKDGNFLGYRGSANDITERKNFLGLMQENERTLMNKSMMLEETNTALRVLLKQIEDGRKEIENTFISNIKRLVLPHIQKALKRHMDDSIRNSLQIALMNLDEIVSPFLNRIERLDFTPKEIEVASHIRDGRSTKEIAEIMGIVPSSVGSHRDNIRKKLGLSNKRVNLRTYLLSMNK
jgi:PAS domain S-box-containing protein